MPTFTYRGHNMIWDSYGEGGNTMLFVHGLGSHGKQWMYQINHFKKFNRVITVDLFGHGQSAKDVDPIFAPRIDAEAIMALISQEIGEAVWVIGHSFASAILPEMIKLDRTLLKGVVFVDCTYQGFDHVILTRENFARHMLEYDDQMLAIRTDKWFDDLIGPTDKSTVNFIKSPIKFCDIRWLFESSAGCRRYNLLHPPDKTPIYPDLPILVIESDHGVGNDIHKSWVNHFRQSQYYLFEDSWHFFFVTKHNQFNKLIENFMIVNSE